MSKLSKLIIGCLAAAVIICGQGSLGHAQSLPAGGNIISGADASSASEVNLWYEYFKQTATIYRDSRVDFGTEYRLKNIGAEPVADFTWYYEFPPADYSNIYAWDEVGPLSTSTERSGDRIYINIHFRNTVGVGETYHFFTGITIGHVAEMIDNTGHVGWYILPYYAAGTFVETMTFPADTLFNSILPLPTLQEGASLEWHRSNWPTNTSFDISVNYTLADTVLVQPFLDLPVNYDGLSFDRAALGIYQGGKGKVNSWVDHKFPNYGKDGKIIPWYGAELDDPINIQCTFGTNCYDGHNGIDFQKYAQDEPIYAAARGRVAEICKNWPASCARGNGYGNYVLIDHENGYATLYAHLKEVASNLSRGLPVEPRQQIGIMGNTGTKPVHLHFGVYYDPSTTPTWREATTAVDPYGWMADYPDPASNNSGGVFPENHYLWKHPLGARKEIGEDGDVLILPSGAVRVTIPANALIQATSLDLVSMPPIALPSASLRSVGRAFQLTTTPMAKTTASASDLNQQDAFIIPVTITTSYDEAELAHLTVDQLTFYRWNSDTQQWSALETEVDTSQRVVQASSTEFGYFDLQAPLACIGDDSEPDDLLGFAQTLEDDVTVIGRMDSHTDSDWARFDVQQDSTYEITVTPLYGSLDPILKVIDESGIFTLAHVDATGMGDSETFELTAATAATYYVVVSTNEDSTVGCQSLYQLDVKLKGHPHSLSVHLPLITQSPPPQTCQESYNPIDLVFALDASGSMNEGGQFQAAVQAIRTFVLAMNLDPEQAGLVTFASTEVLNQGLTADQNTFMNALNTVQTGLGTRLGGGIELAAEELTGPRRNLSNTPVMIVLSDGKNGGSVDPVDAANEAKAAGIRIITIALGPEADTEVLQQVASSPSDYHFAPSAAELEAIYLSIAGEILCR